MLQVSEILHDPLPANEQLVLPFELRCKSRLRTSTAAGLDLALLLPRGTVLRHGDRLRAANGLIIEVQAAPEPVTTAQSDETTIFARACYHLGNRHVPLQVGTGWLRYLADHVLDRMVAELGLVVVHEQAQFEPESGAYHQHGATGGGVFLLHHGH
ncbi:MAG: urease accessory protein UreE [Acidiferrobacterales bacterium]